MKYLIFRDPDGTESARSFLCPTTHQEVALEVIGRNPGRTIVGAGFFEVIGTCRQPWAEQRVQVRTFGRSESLNIDPRPQDALCLAAGLHATLTMARTLFDPRPEPIADSTLLPANLRAQIDNHAILAGSPAFPRHD